MESVKKVAVKHVDGYYVDLHYKPVESIRHAARFNTMDDYNRFLTGFYAPPTPADYMPQTITISYQEEPTDV